VRRIHLHRRDALIHALRRHFGEETQIAGEAAGLHLAWTPPPEAGLPDTIATAARRVGLEAGCVDQLVVLLGFGTASERQLEACVEALATALASAGAGLAGPAERSHGGPPVASGHTVAERGMVHDSRV
jgi:DNA-binding transcriptional MocR family regulator